MRYLVTGYSSGIGQAVARQLEADGHTVYRVGRSGDYVARVDFEEASDDDISTVVKRAAYGAPFDGVFHAAGRELVKPLWAVRDEDWRKAMCILDGAFAILRACASPGVMADGGSIVMMSSVAAHHGVAGMGAYGAARAGIESLVRSAAVEMAKDRVRVNAIAAGAVATPMHQRIIDRLPPASVAGYANAHPLGFGPVEAVRDAALFLLDKKSAWVTGTTMIVDGGYLA